MREGAQRECWSSALWTEGFTFTAAHGSGTRPLSGLERCARLVLFEWPFLRGHQHEGASMADPSGYLYSSLDFTILLHSLLRIVNSQAVPF